MSARLAEILAKEGLRVAVLKAEVKPEAREAWYEKKMREGVRVFIAHPRLSSSGSIWASHPIFSFTRPATRSSPYGRPAGARGGSGSGGTWW